MKRLALVLCLVATGCGGQAMPNAGYGAKSESDLGSELEAKAAEMERELASLEVDKKPDTQTGSADADGDAAGANAEAPAPVEEGGAPMAPPPAEAAPTAAGNEETEADDERAKKRDGCKTACRALGSMKRTEARICELVGDRHDKCTWAHERVKEAVARIERAQCACKD